MLKTTTTTTTQKTISNNVNELYTACLGSEVNNEVNIVNFNKLSSYCKKHKVNLIDIIESRKICKAIYNTICYAKISRIENKYMQAEEVEKTKAEKFSKIAKTFEKTSRRHITLKCFSAKNCTKSEILEILDLYADSKYFRLRKANKKCIDSCLCQNSKLFKLNEANIIVAAK